MPGPNRCEIGINYSEGHKAIDLYDHESATIVPEGEGFFDCGEPDFIYGHEQSGEMPIKLNQGQIWLPRGTTLLVGLLEDSEIVELQKGTRAQLGMRIDDYVGVSISRNGKSGKDEIVDNFWCLDPHQQLEVFRSNNQK